MANKIREIKKKVRETYFLFIEKSDSRKGNLYFAIGYNFLASALIVLAVIIYHDKAGFGLFLIPLFFIIVAPLHCIFLFFKGLKKSFRTGLFEALFILRVNLLLLLADFLFVALLGIFLDKLGIKP